MADGAIAESPRRAHALPSKWLPIAISAVAAGLLLATTYYGLQFFRKSTFDDERSFRILGELIDQFGNLQSTLSSVSPPAQPRPPLTPRELEKAVVQWEKEWLARVALPGIHGLKPVGGDCKSLQNADVLVVDTNDATRRTKLARCEKSQGPPFVVQGNLVEQVAGFVTQQFFDTAIIALEDGTVLATIPRSHRDRTRVELQQSSAQGLIITDVRALLRHAAKANATTGTGPKKEGDSKEGNSPDPVPGYATVFSESIAGEDYRVFVQPFETRLPLMPEPAKGVEPAKGAEPAKGTEPAKGGEPAKGAEPAKGVEPAKKLASPLYMIGVQRENMLGPTTDALGSTGVLLITCVSLLVVLAWPFLSLK